MRRWEAEREVVEFESSLGPAAVKVKRLPAGRHSLPDGRRAQTGARRGG